MKTQTTVDLENAIWERTHKKAPFCCFEVTLGWYGSERVDYMTYDYKHIWRCYEVKSTKKDFYSKAKHTFVGHYNYYVMPQEVYDQVKNDIPDHIGVYIYGTNIKQAQKVKLGMSERILSSSFIRSIYRELEKKKNSEDVKYMMQKDRIIRYWKDEADDYKKRYNELLMKVREKYGRHWGD